MLGSDAKIEICGVLYATVWITRTIVAYGGSQPSPANIIQFITR